MLQDARGWWKVLFINGHLKSVIINHDLSKDFRSDGTINIHHGHWLSSTLIYLYICSIVRLQGPNKTIIKYYLLLSKQPLSIYISKLNFLFLKIMAEMEVMKTRCPTGHSCETYSIGQSFEGREMKVLKVCQIVYNCEPWYIWYKTTPTLS